MPATTTLKFITTKTIFSSLIKNNEHFKNYEKALYIELNRTTNPLTKEAAKYFDFARQ